MGSKWVWYAVQAINSPRVGDEVGAAAIIQVYRHAECTEAMSKTSGSIILQRFADTPLFRFLVVDQHRQLVGTLCLPSNTAWGSVPTFKKVKTKTSGAKAGVIEITVPPTEGYSRITLTVPFNGNDGSTAEYYCSALVHASQVVAASNPTK